LKCDWENVAVYVFITVIVGAVLGLDACYNEWAYGDWKCAFKECISVR
jgi:hypothetical protein